MSIEDGTYPARGVEAALGYTKDGKEQIGVRLLIIGGAAEGQYITWHGYFTEKTTERTLESLRHLGWEGDDLFDLSGIDKNEVSIVVENEEYNGEYRTKVRWINGAGGIAIADRMDDSAARAFSARMKGAVVALKQKKGAPPKRDAKPAARPANVQTPRTEDDPIPF